MIHSHEKVFFLVRGPLGRFRKEVLWISSFGISALPTG